jgi:hypothetical protein
LAFSFAQRGRAAIKQEKSFLYPDFANRPDQKSKGLNPGDSANSDTTIKFLLFFEQI